MPTPMLYEISPINADGTRGKIHTVRGQSPISVVAGCSMQPRHNWEKVEDGLIVTARRGDGSEVGKYHVKQSCFENLPPMYPLG